MKEVKSIPELSKETGMPQFTIRKLVKDGRLPALRLGNKFYIEVARFEALFTTEKSTKEECGA